MGPAADFIPLQFRSVFATTLQAAFFERRQGADRTIALRIEPQHCNSAGYAHGAFLLAVADFALSHGSGAPDDHPPRITLQLSADFMRPAKAGDWLEVLIDTKKSSASLAFADCVMRVGDRVVLTAKGLFRPVLPRADALNVP